MVGFHSPVQSTCNCGCGRMSEFPNVILSTRCFENTVNRKRNDKESRCVHKFPNAFLFSGISKQLVNKRFEDEFSVSAHYQKRNIVFVLWPISAIINSFQFSWSFMFRRIFCEQPERRVLDEQLKLKSASLVCSRKGSSCRWIFLSYLAAKRTLFTRINRSVCSHSFRVPSFYHCLWRIT